MNKKQAKKVKEYERAWFQYTRAKSNGYEDCVDGDEITRIAHFLVYHRWWTVRDALLALGMPYEKGILGFGIMPEAECKAYKEHFYTKTKEGVDK